MVQLVICFTLTKGHSFLNSIMTLLFSSIQESFNVLDCGIYRVISRRGSQSDEETSSLINQSMSEEERLKEFSFVQEEDQVDTGKRSNIKRYWMNSSGLVIISIHHCTNMNYYNTNYCILCSIHLLIYWNNCTSDIRLFWCFYINKCTLNSVIA